MYLSEELKDKIASAIKNNRLIGNARFTEEEYHAMLNITRRIWSNYAWREFDDVNFVTLVEIAKRWRRDEGSEADESGFWDYVFDELELSYD